MPIDPKIYRDMGLNDSEYAQIVQTLCREPTYTEIGMYSVMWSEHCGYKYSRPVLKAFAEYKKAQETGALENAGVVPLGDTGWGVVFKMESHNHPSAVEPYQGAATGVGGILRDIFTMGARPIANLNSLRFGPLTDARNRYLFEHVVKGVGDYGNCLDANETLIWRDANTGGLHFDTIGNFVEARLRPDSITTELTAGVETVSINPKTGTPCWQPVRRVFKRRADARLKIRTVMGRTLTVSPDHPVLTQENDEWRIRLAASLKGGEAIPLLLDLPAANDEAGNDPAPTPIDLIEIIRTSEALRRDVYVALPADWRPTEAVRLALRVIEPSRYNRHAYLKQGRLPLKHFLALEMLIGVDRRELRLFRPSGKANYARAVIEPDALFARFLGYFLAEGCVSRNGSTDKILLTFAHHEEEYVRDVAEAFRALGLTPRFERRDSTLLVYGSSWLLGHLLRETWHCGAGSHEKAFPAFLFGWPASLRHEAIKGLLRGDGSLTTKTHGSHAKIAFSTASRTLFAQTIALLQSEGVVPSLHGRKAYSGHIQGRAVAFRQTYHLEVCNVAGLTRLADVFGTERAAHLAGALERYTLLGHSFPRYATRDSLAFVRVKSVERIERGCDVYDVEVDGTHLFVTSGGIVTHNCVGVPTVGGEITFHPCYSGNPLVNAMSVGIVKMDGVTSARAAGIGNPVLYIGSATGRDGIHGATFASVELTEESEAKRPNVQVGDPFTEKLLIEATLEALATGRIVGIQDMGAAGLTCGTSEMAAKGNVGMDVDVRAVPRRESGMTAYEVMLSESQERMLAVIEKGHEDEVAAVFRKWGLTAAVIGHVTDTGRVIIRDGDVIEADIPARSLADDCPTYFLEAAEPAYIARVQSADLTDLPEPDDYNAVLLRLLAHPTIASKRWVWEQYDHMVQTQTEVLPGAGDAAVLQIRAANGRRIAVTTDCNSRFCYLDPFVGAQMAVAEAARNLSCVGATPKAVTDCLNFPSPEKPEGFWQFRRAVEGMAQACEFFATPVVSGNVSFYNETPDGAIFPTPTVGMVGVFDENVEPVGLAFQSDGDLIYLLRPAGSDAVPGLDGSEYLSLIHGREEGKPALDLDGEKRVQQVTRQAIAANRLRSAHDCSEGGAAVALAESCLAANLGAEIRFAVTDFADQAWSAILFGEAASRVLVSVRPGENQDALLDLAEAANVEAVFIGQVKANERFNAAGLLDLPLSALRDAYESAIPHAMGEK